MSSSIVRASPVFPTAASAVPEEVVDFPCRWRTLPKNIRENSGPTEVNGAGFCPLSFTSVTPFFLRYLYLKLAILCKFTSPCTNLSPPFTTVMKIMKKQMISLVCPKNKTYLLQNNNVFPNLLRMLYKPYRNNFTSY